MSEISQSETDNEDLSKTLKVKESGKNDSSNSKNNEVGGIQPKRRHPDVYSAMTRRSEGNGTIGPRYVFILDGEKVVWSATDSMIMPPFKRRKNTTVDLRGINQDRDNLASGRHNENLGIQTVYLKLTSRGRL